MAITSKTLRLQAALHRQLVGKTDEQAKTLLTGVDVYLQNGYCRYMNTATITTVSGVNLIDILNRPYMADRHPEIRAELARRAATGDTRYAAFAA